MPLGNWSHKSLKSIHLPARFHDILLFIIIIIVVIIIKKNNVINGQIYINFPAYNRL